MRSSWSVVKAVGWAILLLASWAQALYRSRVRSRGWQLNRMLLFLVLAATITAAVQCGASFNKVRSTYAAGRYLAIGTETWFLLTIMCIACGWCITRASVGEEYASAVTLAPLLYLTASVVVVSLSLSEATSSAGFRSLYMAGAIVRIAALIYAWIFVFASSSRERATLAQRHARIRFVESAFKMEEEGMAAPALRTRSQQVSSGIIAQNAETPEDSLYGPEATKAALLGGFNAAVTTYVALIVLSLLLELSGWSPVTRPFADLCEWAFVATLCILLRPRAENPYLLLVDEFRFDVPAPDWRSSSDPPTHSGSPASSASANFGAAADSGGTTEFVPISSGITRAEAVFMQANAVIPPPPRGPPPRAATEAVASAAATSTQSV